MVKVKKLPIKNLSVDGCPIEKYCIAAGEQNKAVSYAANALNMYIEKACGVRLPIVCGVPLGGRCFYFECGKEKNDGQRTSDSFEFFLDGGKNVKFLYANERSAVFAVYRFIEKFLGFRFFTPDCETNIYKGEIVDIIPQYKKSYKFSYRHIVSAAAENQEWRLKHGLHYSVGPTVKDSFFSRLNGIKFAFNWGYFAHTFAELVPFEKYYNTNPEYFSFADGYQGDSGRFQLCLTNPKVREIALERVLGELENNPDCKIISISQNDSWDDFTDNYCKCPTCSELAERENSQSGVLLDFVNKIAGEINKKYPNVFVHTLAYKYNRKPPKNLRPLDNVIIQHCATCCMSHGFTDSSCEYNASYYKELKKWSGIAKNLFAWNYTSSYALYAFSVNNIFTLRENFATYADLGVAGILQQGNQNGLSADFEELRCYLSAKSFDNPYMTESEYMRHTDEFINAYYGEAGAFVKEYITEMHLAAKGRHFAFDNKFLYENPYGTNWQKFDNILKNAEKCKLNRTERERLQRVRVQQMLYRQLAVFDGNKKAYKKRNIKMFKAMKGSGVLFFTENKTLPDNLDKIDTARPPFKLYFKRREFAVSLNEFKKFSSKNGNEKFDFFVKADGRTLEFKIFTYDDEFFTLNDACDWQQDCIEIYISEQPDGRLKFNSNDYSFRINYNGNVFSKNYDALNRIRIKNAKKAKNGTEICFYVDLLNPCKTDFETGFEIVFHNFVEDGYKGSGYLSLTPKIDFYETPINYSLLKIKAGEK